MKAETEIEVSHSYTNQNLDWAPTAEPCAEAVDGNQLLEDLTAVMRRFVVLPKCAPEALALWVLHTYAWELRDVSTYLGIESPEKRCGKTTLLTLLSELVNRPVVAANISSPAFFRVIEEVRPTLLIDEADTLLRGNDELRGILNSGYGRKMAFVVRVTSEAQSSASKLERPEAQADPPGSPIDTTQGKAQGTEAPGSRLAKFSSWCPKAIAAIGRLPDTLADRCILIRMHRKSSQETCERLRDLDATALRRRCARFVKDGAIKIAAARPQIPEGLNDRAADIWEPLLALAELAGGEWPQRAAQAATTLTLTAQETNPIGALLFDIFVLFAYDAREKLFSWEMAQSLNYRQDRPWMELKRGKTINELWLSQQFPGKLGFPPRSQTKAGAQPFREIQGFQGSDSPHSPAPIPMRPIRLHPVLCTAIA